jgi:N-acetylneuraminic acid mutarotase
MVYDESAHQVYSIGGFSISKGMALDSVERYSLDKKEWELVANLNNRRINCGACVIGKNHVFVFGGRNESDTFYDTVERLNIELNLWNLLKIKLPRKLCNIMAFTF